MKFRNIAKALLATTLVAISLPASADLILIEDDLATSPGSSSEANEETLVGDALGMTVMMDFRCESEGLVGCLEGIGTESGGSYSVSQFTGDPAMSDVSWDLTGTGYLLYAIIVKTSGLVDLWGYGDSLDELEGSISGSATLTSPGDIDSISHISFFVARGSMTVPEPGTIALLGLGLIGIGVAARRRKVA